MKNRSRIAGIVPARYASSRFPGKPLAMIGDKTMIQLVYEQASKALDQVFIATDDERIFNVVEKFGGQAIMTLEDHRSGTDRCAEAAENIRSLGIEIDVVVNIQGDEPFIRPEQIEMLADCFIDDKVNIATLVRKAGPDEDIFNPNQPKVVIDTDGYALYFSRAAIPFVRDARQEEWTSRHTYYKHIGIYAYRTGTLAAITKLPPGRLEEAESLEQNRWLENGYRIKTAVTEWESQGIDTPGDLEKARLLINNL